MREEKAFKGIGEHTSITSKGIKYRYIRLNFIMLYKADLFFQEINKLNLLKEEKNVKNSLSLVVRISN